MIWIFILIPNEVSPLRTEWCVQVCGPSGEGYDVEQGVIDECNQLSAPVNTNAGSFKIVSDPHEAVSGALSQVAREYTGEPSYVVGVDVVYCDSWMSYGISAE